MTQHLTGIRPSIRRAIQQLIQEGKFSINTKPAEIFAIWDRTGPITNAARSSAHELIRQNQDNLGLNFLRQCSCGRPHYNNYKIQATIDANPGNDKNFTQELKHYLNQLTKNQ
jgi:hypothetical protein